MNEVAQSPARRGRPPKAKIEDSPAATPVAKKYKMKAKPNWEDLDPEALTSDSPDRLHISRDQIPEGMDLQWVTDSVFGQPMPQHRAEFEKRGWTPVHQEDFDGRFNGIWMPRGAPGEIKVEGVVLMARPIEISIKARRLERRAALEAVQIKESSLKGGDLPGVTLDSQHPNALNSNRINRSMDGAFVPTNRIPED